MLASPRNRGQAPRLAANQGRGNISAFGYLHPTASPIEHPHSSSPRARPRLDDSTTRRQNVAQLRWSCFRRGINGSHSASVWRSVRLPRWTWVRPLDYSPENADIAGGDRCSHSHLAKTLPKLARVRQRAQPSHEFPGQGRHAARSTQHAPVSGATVLSISAVKAPWIMRGSVRSVRLHVSLSRAEAETGSSEEEKYYA
jgi:hypothetical protein